MPEKTITGWLVVDWKDGSHRTRQSKPDQHELGSNELLAEIAVDVNVPEVDIPKLALDIDVPEPQVYAATLEALDDEALPDWTDAVHEVVATREPDIEVADRTALPDLIDQLTTRTLLQVNTRPNPEHVHDYVTDVVMQTRGADEDSEEVTEADA